MLLEFVELLLDIVLSCQADLVPQVGAGGWVLAGGWVGEWVSEWMGGALPCRLICCRRRCFAALQVRWAQQLHRLLRVHRRKLK